MSESDHMAELASMRARGQLSEEEFKLAKKYLAEEMKKLRRTMPASAAEKPKLGTLKAALAILVGIVALHWFAPQSDKSADVARVGKTSVSELSEGVKVVSSAYKDDWPYPRFDSGIIRCRTEIFGQSGRYALHRPVVTITLGGEQYGMNGAALDAGYDDPRSLMPTDGHGIFKGRIPTVVSEFLQIGMARCG